MGTAYFRGMGYPSSEQQALRGCTGPFAAIADRSSRLAIRQELMEACRKSRVIAAGVTVDLAAFDTVVDTPEKKDAFGDTSTHQCWWPEHECELCKWFRRIGQAIR